MQHFTPDVLWVGKPLPAKFIQPPGKKPQYLALNLLRTLPRPPVTIFTTAYADFAVEAFNLNVADYLLKPFSFERFLQAVNKAKERLRDPTAAALPLAGTEEHRDFFPVKVDGKVVKVRYEDILFIEGLKEYVRIVCRDARYVTLESLKNLSLIAN